MKLNYVFVGFVILVVIATITYQQSLPSDKEMVDYCCNLLCSQDHPNWSRTQLNTFCFVKGDNYWNAAEKYDRDINDLKPGSMCHHSYGPEVPDGKVSAWEFLCWRDEVQSVSDKMAEFCGCPSSEVY